MENPAESRVSIRSPFVEHQDRPVFQVGVYERRAFALTDIWMPTPDNALFIGSRIEHELDMIGQVSMRALYIDPSVLSDQA